MKYLVLIEPAGRSWSGWVPDLPGCVATGKSPKQVRRRLAGAIRTHLDGMEEEGDPPPEPVTHGEYVKV